MKYLVLMLLLVGCGKTAMTELSEKVDKLGQEQAQHNKDHQMKCRWGYVWYWHTVDYRWVRPVKPYRRRINRRECLRTY